MKIGTNSVDYSRISGKKDANHSMDQKQWNKIEKILSNLKKNLINSGAEIHQASGLKEHFMGSVLNLYLEAFIPENKKADSRLSKLLDQAKEEINEVLGKNSGSMHFTLEEDKGYPGMIKLKIDITDELAYSISSRRDKDSLSPLGSPLGRQKFKIR